MTDEEIVDTWMTLDPAPDERRRINTQVSAWLEAHDTSIASEWIGLFKRAPLAALGLSAVSAVAVVVATPVLWLARVLM